MADNINTACETALTEDKPPCVQVTWYVLEADGSNVLKATLAYFGKTTTNANNEVVNKIKLPPRIMNGLSAAPFWAPNGEEIILNQKTDIEDLGPAILASLQRSHLPNAIAGVSPARQRPNIYIESPNQSILTQPIIDVKGISDQPLLGVSYDVLNDLQTLTNQHGFVTDDFFDNQQLRFTTNWFSCFDINLAPGTNAVFVRGYYPNGRLTIKKIYVLRLDLKTNAPTFQINWPSLDQQISGEEFTLRGNTDDDNATVTGEITDGNQSKVIKGEVERGGRFWLEHVPLFSKTNHIKISVTDVVGNSSVTNLTIVKSEDIIIINHIPPRQLLQMQVMVTGKISPPNRNVWVNGLKANVQTNGEWMVGGVPLTKGGTAIFDVLAMPLSEPLFEFTTQNATTNSEIKPQESISIKTAYAPTAIILNASQPTYGTFKIHLDGTEGQNFVLQDSTNLADWTPILTNLNSAATFDYYDTNVVLYGCRFFRIAPVP